MRLLLDECVDRRLARDITGHDVLTVIELVWSGIRNGVLLQRMKRPRRNHSAKFKTTVAVAAIRDDFYLASVGAARRLPCTLVIFACRPTSVVAETGEASLRRNMAGLPIVFEAIQRWIGERSSAEGVVSSSCHLLLADSSRIFL